MADCAPVTISVRWIKSVGMLLISGETALLRMSAATWRRPLTSTNVRDVGSKAMSYAEANVKAAFDHAQKLVHAKDIQEVMALQADYLKTQMAAAQTQAKDFGAVVQAQAKDIGAAVQKTAAAATAAVKK